MKVSEFLGFKKGKTAQIDGDEDDPAAPLGGTVQSPLRGPIPAAEQECCTENAPASDDFARVLDEKPLALRSLLTRPVIIAASNYATLSLVDISFRAIQPLFFSTPINLGGLGLPPSSIGNILSIFGVLNGVFQVFFFARLNERWGSKRVFIAGIISALPVFITFPVINYLARTQGYSPAVWIVVGLQIVASVAISVSYGELCNQACIILF